MRVWPLPLRYLVKEGADLLGEDVQGSNVLHFASSSDSSELVLWLLGYTAVKEMMDKANNVREGGRESGREQTRFEVSAAHNNYSCLLNSPPPSLLPPARPHPVPPNMHSRLS